MRINFDADHNTCHQCINNCEDLDNYFNNHKDCLIKQNNEKGGES